MSVPTTTEQYNDLFNLKENNREIRESIASKLHDIFNEMDNDSKASVSLAHTLNEVLDSSETSYERLIKLQQQDKQMEDEKNFNEQALIILKSSNNTSNKDMDDVENKLQNSINEVTHENPIRQEELKTDPTDL